MALNGKREKRGARKRFTEPRRREEEEEEEEEEQQQKARQSKQQYSVCITASPEGVSSEEQISQDHRGGSADPLSASTSPNCLSLRL